MSKIYSNYYYFEIAVFVTIIIVCIVFLAVQIMVIKQKFGSIKSIKKTFISSTIVYFSFMMHCVFALIGHTISSKICICKYSSQLTSLFYDFGKWSMWWFFICRAELAQGIITILPDIVFKKIIPLNLILSFLFTFIVQILFMELECPSNMDIIIDSYCLWTYFPHW
eukprot:162927_1